MTPHYVGHIHFAYVFVTKQQIMKTSGQY